MEREFKEQFIDADAPYSKESNFEQEILRQMRRCDDNLSKELTGGTVRVRMTKTGQQETYIEDVHELVINSVDTFRILIQHFIKEKHKEKIEKIYNDIKEFQEDLGEKTTMVRGIGMVKIKDIVMLHRESPVWREFILFKTNKHREIYQILIQVYNDNKAEIAKFSEE